MQGEGRFGWYELSTPDPKAAEAFYTSVVGWTAQPFGGDMPYTVLMAGEMGVAGMAGLEGPDPKPGWIGYIGVSDTDAKARALTQAGGAVRFGPDDIPGVGRFAVCADPQGAAFNLLTPSGMEEVPWPKPGTPGTIGWHELHTTDWEKAWDFYSGQFGWGRGEAMDMGPMGTYQIFSDGEEQVGAMGTYQLITEGGAPFGAMFNSTQIPRPMWLFYFNVASIDAAVEKVKSGGGQVINGPMEVPGGTWIINGVDPQGAMFALTGPR